jgi:hypothetical protein
VPLGLSHHHFGASDAGRDEEEGEMGYRVDFESHYVKGKVLGGGSFGVVHQAVNRQS